VGAREFGKKVREFEKEGKEGWAKIRS